MAETPIYSHFDIYRYLQHKMSPQEMHDFERSLMDDPFLADALEGYSTSDQVQSEADLAEIERQLTGEKEETRVVPIATKKTSWWMAAAVILIVAAGGILTWSLVSRQADNQNAVNRIARKEAAEAQKVADSIGPAETTLAHAEPPFKKSVFSKARPSLPITAEESENSAAVSNPVSDSSIVSSPMAAAPMPGSSGQTNSTSQPIAESTVNIPSAKAKEPAAALAAKDKKAETAELRGKVAGVTVAESTPYAAGELSQYSKANIEKSPQILNQFNGRVVNEAGQPVGGASILVNNTKSTTIADQNGKFVVRAPDSLIQVTVGTPGYLMANAAINSKAAVNNITLHENVQVLQEVVVSKVGTRKKRMFSKTDSSAAEPIGGWKNFKQYLSRQVDSLKAGNNENYYDDDVVLEFSIDKKGQATNIKVKDQPGKTVADKAVQILSNGPKWNKKKDKKVILTIPF